jgi:hypothetical protein
MTAHDGMPALAGLRPVAIEVMRFGFIVFSGAEVGFFIQLLRPPYGCDPLRCLLRYPASNPFCRAAYTGWLSNGGGV